MLPKHYVLCLFENIEQINVYVYNTVKLSFISSNVFGGCWNSKQMFLCLIIISLLFDS